jgi:branched-chain amino acid transport system substrate-binding protein
VTLAVASATVAGCSSSGGAPGGQTSGASGGSAPYRFALVGSLTGPYATSGVARVNGFKTAIDQVNESGGLNGHRIKASVYDDQSLATTSVTVTRNLLDSKPTAILDAGFSNVYAARSSLFSQAKIPVFAAGPVPDGPVQPWLYIGQANSIDSEKSYVDSVARALGGTTVKGKRILFITVPTPAGQAGAENAAKVIRAQGGTALPAQYSAPGTASFASGAAKAVSEHPDGAILGTLGPDSVVIAKALIDAGYKGKMAGTYVGADEATFKAINSDQYVASVYSGTVTPDSPIYTVAKKDGRTTGIEAPDFSLAYIGASLVIAGLKQCAYPCSASGLQKAMDSQGEFTPAGGVAPYGPFKVSATQHNLPYYYQKLHWDSANSKVVPDGKPFTIGGSN